jgi:hypothetical protein
MVKIVARLAPALLLISCVAMIAAPSASAAPGSRASAVTARPGAHVTPTIAGPLAGYTFSGGSDYTNFNTQSGAITVANPSTGFYQVTFGNLGGLTGGIVQVTPNDDTGTCSVGGWGPSGGDLEVNVYCYTPAGSPEDSLFDLIVTQPTMAPPGTFDYAYVYKEASSGTLTGVWEYNSAHKSNKVKHLGTGRYQVMFGGKASSGTHGTVKVSAYGSRSGDCVASGWHGTSVGQVVGVNCYTASGHPINRQFTVTYAGRTNLMGIGGFPTVNALIGSTGRVMTQFDSQPHAHVTVRHTGTGLYKVQLNGTTENIDGGDVQVSPITGGKDHCVVVTWNGGSGINTVVTVHCFNNPGSPANSAFTLQFVEGFLA